MKRFKLDLFDIMDVLLPLLMIEVFIFVNFILVVMILHEFGVI